MIVEDDDNIRESLVEFLEQHGYQALEAVDGRDALDKLAAAKPPPCAILLDLMMPIMDGQGFREEQLRDPVLSAIPVVVVSAYRDVDERTQGLAVASHLKKPLDLTELLRVLEQFCR
jgi:CheY-like chemotaxis protein